MDVRQAIVAVFLVVFCIFFWAKFASYTAVKTAYEGYSPIEIVHRHFMPEHHLRDFPSGTENYKKSAFTYVYLAAYRYLGVQPETMIPVVMAFEIGLIACTFMFLTRAIFPQALPAIPYLVVLLFIASYTKELDLGRVGVYLEGKVNNVGDMLRMLAIGCTLSGRLIPAGVLIGLSFMVNPLMAFIGGVFVAACQAMEPGRLLQRQTLAAAALSLMLSLGWMVLMYERSNITGGSIPDGLWFDISRMSSYHWFPVEFGLFTTLHEERFIPLLSFTILFFHGLPRPLRDVDRMVLGGMAAMAILIAVGAVVPMLDISQMLVKLNLVRADEIVIAIGLIYVVHGLMNEIASGAVVKSALASSLLVSPFLVKPGFPLLMALLLVVPPILRRDIRRWTASDCAAISISVLVIGLMGVYTLAGMTGSFWSPAYTGGKLLLGLIAFFAAIGAIRNLALSGLAPERFAVVIVLIASLASVLWVIKQKPSEDYLKLAASYREVQEWAKESTPTDSLFMTDPTIYYGWREYSRRSSFGNLREWTYNWANSNDYETYREGMKRFGELGLELEPYLRYNPAVRGFSALSDEVSKRYHLADDGWRNRLVERYGIDYFVMDKNKMIAPPAEPGGSFQRVYENRDFLVLKPRAEG